jgi:protein gp37
MEDWMGTKIEWAEETINPITGCTPISEGCAHCYAKRMATRLAGRYGYPKDDPFRPGVFHPEELKKPAKWRKPRRIFVCSMGDIFHDRVKPADLYDVFEMMQECQQHTFILLTKRPERAPKNETWWTENIWLGVTVENQRHDDRILKLKEIPAAKKFISFEPLIGSIEFLPHILKWIDWAIVGAETGPGKRKMETEWATRIRDQCVSAGVPFFFKKDSNGHHNLETRIWEQMPEVAR